MTPGTLAVETRDLQLFERFLERAKASGSCDHFELLELTIATCTSAGAPGKAWALRKVFDGLSLSGAEPKIIDAVAAVEGAAAVRKLARQKLDEALREGWTASAAQALALWSRHDPEGAAGRLAGFLGEIDVSALEPRYGLRDFLAAMAETLVRVGQRDGLETLFAKAPEGAHWFKLLEVIEPGDALWSKALAQGLASVDSWSYGQLLHAAKRDPEAYAHVLDALTAAAGRDRADLERLVDAVASTGDWESANSVRMKAPKAQRRGLSSALARQGFKLGHLSCALAMIKELDRGFGSDYQEYELMRGLVYDRWDGVARASSVLG